MPTPLTLSTPRRLLTRRLFALAGLICLVCLIAACSDDSAVAGGDGDTQLDSGFGDINTDLFSPSDGGFGDGDAAPDGAGGADQGDDSASDDTGGETFLDRYDSCGFGGPQCEPPLTCVGTCQLPCSAGCPDDEECISLGDFGAAGVCGVRGGEGDDCDITQGLFCEEDLNCEEGTCTAPVLGGEGDDCGGFGEQCDEGLTCVITGFGEGYCGVDCGDSDPCDEGEVCVPSGIGSSSCFEDCDGDDEDCSDPVDFECRTQIGDTSGEDACLPRLGDPPGEQEFGEVCGGEDRCVDGLFCPGLPGAYCTQACGGPTDCPDEPEGATCVNLGFQGVCGFVCPTGDPAECPEGMNCTNAFGQNICAWP